jgi:endogenous inhibitor of DNA gyrase (YacG/DUF329 family)
MPIPTRCRCGASFSVPDEFAGRKVKCPKCSEPVAVAAGDAAASAAVSSSAPIGIKCVCGKPLKVPGKLAGKTVKCPSCGEAIPVPDPAKAAAAALAAAADIPAADGVTELLDEAALSISKTGRRCPECRTDMQLDDIICINCGYNTETGRKMKVKKVETGKRVAGVRLKTTSEPARPTAPPPVQALVKLLNQAGALALLIAIGIVGYLGFLKMQADPAAPTDALLTVLTESGIYILGGFALLVTVPCALAAKLVESGHPVGRILCIVMGFVTLPVFLLGALILKLAFSDDVNRFCR